MINHARTLLMNVDGSLPQLTYFGEEIVDPSFRALAVPTPVQAVRNVLFGANPDRYMLNYRCRQLLALIRASKLAEFIPALDPRITYDFRDNTLFQPATFETQVQVLGGNALLAVYGVPDSPDKTGRIHHTFLIATIAPNTALITRITAPSMEVEVSFTVGESVALPGSGLTCVFNSDWVGQGYRVDAYARPQLDLAQLLANSTSLGAANYDYLFGVPIVEPFLTFQNLWRYKFELPLQLGALLCAVIYRMEALRLAQ